MDIGLSFFCNLMDIGLHIIILYHTFYITLCNSFIIANVEVLQFSYEV